MNVDYSAFEGWDIEGRPAVVTVRGQVAVRDGKFVGTVGRGQFLKRPAARISQKTPASETGSSSTWRALPFHPLMEPSVMPFTKRRIEKMKRTMTGTLAIA